jgi:response regulator RpfG family c-di-GMP phosphodiesterase
MTRVYLNGFAFLTYYNNLVSSSHAITKLRINFDKTYKPFYSSLLPHLHPDRITLERVFLGGMRAISESDFYNWAVGFLIHDIGKAAAVEYHEGESAYNRDIVTEHVKVGYTSVVNKTNYPKAAALIIGYHHEYYGDPGGYGYFRTYLEQYRNVKPKSQTEYCMAFELEPMMDCQALAYFPAKLVEIIDVFDSVTDPNRKYRKAMTTEEALVMMDEEFVKKHPKIDPILFDIFTKFAREKETV